MSKRPISLRFGLDPGNMCPGGPHLRLGAMEEERMSASNGSRSVPFVMVLTVLAIGLFAAMACEGAVGPQGPSGASVSGPAGKDGADGAPGEIRGLSGASIILSKQVLEAGECYDRPKGNGLTIIGSGFTPGKNVTIEMVHLGSIDIDRPIGWGGANDSGAFKISPKGKRDFVHKATKPGWYTIRATGVDGTIASHPIQIVAPAPEE